MLELALAAGGIALQAFGSKEASDASSKYYQGEQNIAGLEMKVNDQRKAAMEVDARRRQLEVVRNNQRARSMAQTTATNQGAQFGTGLQGAYGGISGQSETNLLGVNQNLEIGRNIFGLDTQISQQRIANAGYESQINTDKATANFGGMLTNSAGTINKLFSSGAAQAGQLGSMLTNGPFGIGS